MKPNRSSYLPSVIDLLRFDGQQLPDLPALSPAAWNKLLAAADEARLTLALGLRKPRSLPDSSRERIESNAKSNRQRYNSLKTTYSQLSGALSAAGINFCFLKGITNSPDYCDLPWQRPQYDVDLLVAPQDSARAWDAILFLGYQPHGAAARQASIERRAHTDHLPPLIPVAGRHWRGDYFDPDLAPSVEVHFRLWDTRSERFDFPDWPAFFDRRQTRWIDGLAIPSLHPVDHLAYAAMHFLRHLLRGDLKAVQPYEIAYFLQRRCRDAAFWQAWSAQCCARSRALQSVTFAISAACFGCAVHTVPAREIESLPSAVRSWVGVYSPSLFDGAFANKPEILLHLALLENTRDRAAILVRRLVPHRWPDEARNHRARSLPLLWSRFLHHAFAAPRLLLTAARFLRARSRPLPRFGKSPAEIVAR